MTPLVRPSRAHPRRLGTQGPATVRDERGEGVISAAIVVLIMALIGAAMWVAFNGVFEDASGRVADSVGQIGG